MAAAAPRASAPDEPETVSAAPTKEFFISMLVRDIDLDDAIVDLVDNCVDGARRIKPLGDFAGLSVRISLSETEFRIVDNCGGIPFDRAKDYAFCFGRPKEAKGTDHSIGRFGVGMKRAFFKMGKRFKVETHTSTDHYQVSGDVDVWSGVNEWKFPFKRLDTPPAGSEPGTTIIVEGLYDEVKHDFADEEFANRLRRLIGEKHPEALTKGLGITVGITPVQFSQLSVLRSDSLEPAVSMFEMGLRKPVAVKVIAGLGPSVPRDAGWYVYCNGRQVLKADTTPLTGWGGGAIPKFHNQFAEFRGFAFMESDDTDLLPWRTTKTGVDLGSTVYRRVLQEMVDLSRPVIDFLNQKKEESESAAAEQQLLAKTVSDANKVDIATLTGKQTWKAPQPDYEPLPEEARIMYWESVERIRNAKTQLGVSKNPDVGRRTFQYYYDAEVPQP